MGDAEHAGKLDGGAGLYGGVGYRTGCEGPAAGVDDGLVDVKGGCSGAVVGDGGARCNVGGVAVHLGGDERAPLGNMQRRRLCQPDVAVDSRAFIEPAFLHGGVDPDSDDIGAAVVEVIGQIVAEAGVTAALAAEVEAVDPDDRVAEDPVKFDADATAEIGGGN